MSVSSSGKESKFILTGRRQISRILDIGLIVPELVGCDNSNNICILDSSSLYHVKNVTPILIELKKNEEKTTGVFSVDQILAIHFSSEEEKEDYLNRPFENVPNTLFDLVVSPSLFSEQSEQCNEIYLSKVDRGSLSKKYRKVDVFLGLAWECIIKKGSSYSFSAFEKKYTEFNPYSDGFGEEVSKLIDLSIGIITDKNIAVILSEYFSNIEKYPLESGWPTKSILQDLKDWHEQHQPSSDLFEKWFAVAIAIVNNDRGLPDLNDENQILLRAILLHLINPDKGTTSRLSNNGANIGEKVSLVFEFLNAARIGFSAMSAEEKSTYPGAYFLLSKLAASWVNNADHIPLEPTKTMDEGFDVYYWNNQIIGRYKSQIVPIEPLSTGIDDGGLAYLIGGLESLSIVSKVEISKNDSALLKLNKKEVVDISIPRHSNFTILLAGDCVVFSTCILNFSFASHLKKLTGPRMKSAFKYQGCQERNFRFVIDDDTFNAEVSVNKSSFNPYKADEMLKVLLDTHVWMKGKAT